VREWAKQLASKKLDAKKETELLPGFVADVFEAALGYTRPPSPTPSSESLIEVDGKFATVANPITRDLSLAQSLSIITESGRARQFRVRVPHAPN
jgi:hypothetical protein